MVDSKAYIIEFLKEQFILSLGTISNNEFSICTIFYATKDGVNLYFSSSNNSKHCINILQNNKIFINLYRHNTLNGYELEKIGLQGIGVATKILDINEVKKALKLYGSRFIGAKNWIDNPHEFIEEASGHSIYKITVKKAKMINTKIGIKMDDYIIL